MFANSPERRNLLGSSPIQADFFVSSSAFNFMSLFDQIFFFFLPPIATIPQSLLGGLLSDICVLTPHSSVECAFGE